MSSTGTKTGTSLHSLAWTLYGSSMTLPCLISAVPEFLLTLFKNIVLDMDVLLIQYGPPAEQSDAEARSRFLAPIVNHLIAQFGSSFQNTPRSVVAGLITTRGRVEYHFKTFAGAISVVFVEVKFRIGDPEERLDAIAQVIAECYACNWQNTRVDFNVPVYGILCDGASFLFFAFDGSINPYKFTMGVVPGSRFRGLKLVDFSSEPTARHFIHSLCSICETIFNLLLCAYIAGLKAFRDRFASQHRQQKSLDGWDKALKFAEEALEESQDAEVLRQENSIVDADATVEAAFKALKLSTDAVPIAEEYTNPPLIDGWDEDEVAKV
ncbi:hypothetical protein EDB85DRAFT_1085527 [Lactarius pseudohatsudake]|nr:hypothetical protein EDB85DRAFT_1085527 [Lactarius pseudohatsudake]